MSDDVDLNLVAAFAQDLNAEMASINETSEGIAQNLPRTPQPQNFGADGGQVIKPSPVNFANDGFGEVDEELLRASAVARQAPPQHNQPHPTAPVRVPTTPKAGAVDVFPPDLQSVILRQLMTIQKNQTKILSILTENKTKKCAKK